MIKAELLALCRQYAPNLNTNWTASRKRAAIASCERPSIILNSNPSKRAGQR